MLLRYNSLPCGTECCSRMAARPGQRLRKTDIYCCRSLRLSSRDLPHLSSPFLVGRSHIGIFGEVFLPFSTYISVHFDCWMSICSHFYPTALKGCRGIFSPMVSGWPGGQVGGGKKVCPGCISETVRCRKLILGRDIG